MEERLRVLGTTKNADFQPNPNSSGDSSGVPHRRQMTAEQSPQVSGSVTSTAQAGQYSRSGWGFACGV